MKDEYIQSHPSVQMCSFSSLPKAKSFIQMETQWHCQVVHDATNIQHGNTGTNNQYQQQSNARPSPTMYAPPDQTSTPPGQFFPSGQGFVHPNLSPPGFSNQFYHGPNMYANFQPQMPMGSYPFGGMMPPGPFQPAALPIYIAKEPPKFKLPKDWDFKHKMEMACQELNMTFLTSDTETTFLTTEPSKKFAEALHAVVPHLAMADFLGANHNFYCTKGIEMYQRFCYIHEPTHPTAITSILDQLMTIHMALTKTPSAYKLRIELLNEHLPAKVAYAPALLAHVAYKGLDPNRYVEIFRRMFEPATRVWRQSQAYLQKSNHLITLPLSSLPMLQHQSSRLHLP